MWFGYFALTSLVILESFLKNHAKDNLLKGSFLFCFCFLMKAGWNLLLSFATQLCHLAFQPKTSAISTWLHWTWYEYILLLKNPFSDACLWASRMTSRKETSWGCAHLHIQMCLLQKGKTRRVFFTRTWWEFCIGTHHTLGVCTNFKKAIRKVVGFIKQQWF